MNKAELETKHLSELHALAAEAGVERYRMLSRAELIEKLSGGESGPSAGAPAPRAERKERAPRERPPRERPPRERPPRRRRAGAGEEAPAGGTREPGPTPPEAAPEPTPAPATPAPAASEEPSPRPRRRRRRRRFGRKGKEGVSIQDLLLPPAAGRQAILCAETREGCTALLRGVAADLSADSKGPDPVVLLIDPSPEELADWKREAPQAEIVAAGQARHASDALAQAAARAGSGEDVMLLVDSLTRLASAYGDADSAKEFFDAGRVQGATANGSLTVVVALERPASS
ncbi:MAG: Rho termination factor N-terminal domain-containing protein [Solirubrobacterales bacterium]